MASLHNAHLAHHIAINIKATLSICSLSINIFSVVGARFRSGSLYLFVLQFAVYHSLPFVELSPVDHLYPKEIMDEMKYRRYGANVRDKMKGFGGGYNVRKRINTPALMMVYDKIATKPQPIKHKSKVGRIKKVYTNCQKGTEYENGDELTQELALGQEEVPPSISNFLEPPCD